MYHASEAPTAIRYDILVAHVHSILRSRQVLIFSRIPFPKFIKAALSRPEVFIDWSACSSLRRE